MTPEIRPIREDELLAYLDATSTGFLERPDVARLADEVRSRWELSRTWAAFEGGRICGTFRSWATEITVPGLARLPAAAVSGVSVLPTHRRRGVLRAMVAAEHAALRERGEVIGLLYASEYPIYGRFGYGSAADVAKWTLDAHGTTFRGDPQGRVEMAPADPASRDAIRAVFDAWRLRQPGEIRRRDFVWDHDLGLLDTGWGERWKGFLAFHRDDEDIVDGYVRYHADSKWVMRQPRNEVIVDELHALTSDAYDGLWRFLAEIDWVATVRADSRSPAEPLRWRIVNARAASVSDVGDGLWVRLFDAPRALEARSWERSGRVVLELIDDEAAGGRQRVELDASPHGARCRATRRSPDLTLHVSALGAAYLGGTRLRDAVMSAGADEHRDGALTEADALLRTADVPWCSTFF